MSRPAGMKFEIVCRECGASFTAGNTVQKRCPPCRARELQDYRNAYWRERRRNDPEHARKRNDQALAYHYAHRDEKLAYFRANREYRREQARIYRVQHRDDIREHRNANAERYAEYGRHWRNENRQRYRAIKRANQNRRRARALATGGSWTADEFEALCFVAGYRCYYCGIRADKIQAEHRIPLARGGSNDISNIVPSCGPCNHSKHTKTDEEFLAWLAASRSKDKESLP